MPKDRSRRLAVRVLGALDRHQELIDDQLHRIVGSYDLLPERRPVNFVIEMDWQVREGEGRGFAESARRARVSRARITQILDLNILAPDIQEEILFLPRVESGRDPIREHVVTLPLQFLLILAVSLVRQVHLKQETQETSDNRD